MNHRTLVAALCLAAAAGCSGGSGGSSVPGQANANGNPVQQPILFTGAINDNLSSSDPNYLQKTLVFGKIGITIATTASEGDNYTGTFTLTPTATTGCPTPSNVFSITTTDHKTFSITSNAVGICKLAAADASGRHTGVLWVSVSTASGVGN
jgi:hypothetical protein